MIKNLDLVVLKWVSQERHVEAQTEKINIQLNLYVALPEVAHQ